MGRGELCYKRVRWLGSLWLGVGSGVDYGLCMRECYILLLLWLSAHKPKRNVLTASTKGHERSWKEANAGMGLFRRTSCVGLSLHSDIWPCSGSQSFDYDGKVAHTKEIVSHEGVHYIDISDNELQQRQQRSILRTCVCIYEHASPYAENITIQSRNIVYIVIRKETENLVIAIASWLSACLLNGGVGNVLMSGEV
jgi:hypothetical protein